MRLISFLDEGLIHLGGIRSGGPKALVFDLNHLEPSLPQDMVSFLEAGKPALELAEKVLAEAPAAAAFDFDRVTLKAPVQRPGKIIAIGQNYLMHAKESGDSASKYPIIFAKYGNTVIGHGEPIVIPKATSQVDYEGELAVVIGRRCKAVSQPEALSCVGGYTAVNDVSARDYQTFTRQWTIGKTFDTFAPMGPVLTTADEIPDPQNINLRVEINGEEMQAANTREMIFPVARLIAILTEVMTLDPGDVILTGTPAGVGMARKPPRWLRPGDVVRVEIDRIGVLENPVVAES